MIFPEGVSFCGITGKGHGIFETVRNMRIQNSDGSSYIVTE